MEELPWINEKIERLEKNNGLYKFACFFIGRKLSYKEMYMLLQNINRKKLGDEDSKKFALYQIIEIYKFQNGKLPDGIGEYDRT